MVKVLYALRYAWTSAVKNLYTYTSKWVNQFEKITYLFLRIELGAEFIRVNVDQLLLTFHLKFDIGSVCN